MRQVETKSVVDAKGRAVRTVLAREADSASVAQAEIAESDDLQRVLLAMAENPGARRLTTIAQAAGLLSHVGAEDAAAKEKARKRLLRRLDTLIAAKLVERNPLAKAEFRLTNKGSDEAAKMTGVRTTPPDSNSRSEEHTSELQSH